MGKPLFIWSPWLNRIKLTLWITLIVIQSLCTFHIANRFDLDKLHLYLTTSPSESKDSSVYTCLCDDMKTLEKLCNSVTFADCHWNLTRFYGYLHNKRHRTDSYHHTTFYCLVIFFLCLPKVIQMNGSYNLKVFVPHSVYLNSFITFICH